MCNKKFFCEYIKIFIKEIKVMKQRKGLEDILVAFQGDIEELDTLKLPSPYAVQEWRDFKDRKLTLDFEIGESLGQFIKYILLWNKEE